ncbi:MAG TPA: glutathione S-transferase N-terminal domain-containing protein [Xanthobacteraceae bacterium]|nr:glutathione S-transferase N-terminal domain-containing protein [Xanthobacteraceae bacterium]
MVPTFEKFVLRSTLTSPFGRKVRIAAMVLGLSERITLVPADTRDENDTLREQNPLGKMPCLLIDDGTVLYDSRVIIEFLQEVAGSERLLPARGLRRYEALARASLADGVTDAALLMVYEGRFRGTGTPAQLWLDHQRGKVVRGLAAFEGAPPDPTVTDVVSIGLACALGYLDWRKPVTWRADHPGLVAWLAAFEAREPAATATRLIMADAAAG